MPQVDNKLREIMKQIHNSCLRNARKYGTEGDYTRSKCWWVFKSSKCGIATEYLSIVIGNGDSFLTFFIIESGT